MSSCHTESVVIATSHMIVPVSQSVSQAARISQLLGKLCLTIRARVWSLSVKIAWSSGDWRMGIKWWGDSAPLCFCLPGPSQPQLWVVTLDIMPFPLKHVKLSNCTSPQSVSQCQLGGQQTSKLEAATTQTLTLLVSLRALLKLHLIGEIYPGGFSLVDYKPPTRPRCQI